MKTDITVKMVVDAALAAYHKRNIKSELWYKQLSDLEVFINEHYNGDICAFTLGEELFEEEFLLNHEEQQRLTKAQMSGINELFKQYNRLAHGDTPEGFEENYNGQNSVNNKQQSGFSAWFKNQLDKNPISFVTCIILFLAIIVVLIISANSDGIGNGGLPEYNQPCVVEQSGYALYESSYFEQFKEYLYNEDIVALALLKDRGVTCVVFEGTKGKYVRYFKDGYWVLHLEGHYRPVIIESSRIRPIGKSDDTEEVVIVDETPASSLNVEVRSNFGDEGADKWFSNDHIFAQEKRFGKTLESVFEKYYNKPIDNDNFLEEEPLKRLIVNAAGEDAIEFMKGCSKSTNGMIRENMCHLTYIYDCYKKDPKGDGFTLCFSKWEDKDSQFFIEIQRNKKLYKYQYSRGDTPIED